MKRNLRQFFNIFSIKGKKKRIFFKSNALIIIKYLSIFNNQFKYEYEQT